jgi:hypothetical protein
MSTWQTMGLRVVEVDGMAPDEWMIVPHGRFVQTLAPGAPSMSFVMGRVEQYPAPDHVQYIAFAKLNGTVRWEPAGSDTNAPKETR